MRAKRSTVEEAGGEEVKPRLQTERSEAPPVLALAVWTLLDAYRVCGMTLVIPANHGQYAHHFTIPGDNQEMLVTGGYEAEGVDTTPNQVASDLHDLAKTLVNARLPTQVTLKRTTTTLVVAVGQDPIVGERIDPSTGGRASSNLLTQNTAWLVKKLTAEGGRRNKGRQFWPGVPDVSVNDVGVLNANEVTDWNTALATYRTGALASDRIARLVLFHTLPPASTNPLAPTTITALIMDGMVATQRQRLRR